MKLSLGRTFDTGQVLQALSKAGVKGIDDFITYLQDFSTQTINALRSTLTFEDNFNCLVKTIELTSAVSQTIQLPNQKKSVRHIIPTQSVPFANAVTQFNWQITDTGLLEVKASFAGSPTAAVQITMVILF